MNRFEVYNPINFEIPEYVSNPEAFSKILAGQDALFEQKQKEKESMLSAGDKLAQSLKYAPDDSYKAIYDQTLSDYRAAQDEVETAYKTKGIAAGEAALRKYKKTLSDDFTNGRASKLMSSAAQWEDTKKRVTEMYKDNPQAAYYYLNGAGKSEWFKPYGEGKDANIGQPSLLKSLKDADVTKAIVESLKNVKPDVQSLVSYLTPDAPQWLINGVKTSSDPYHYIMDESVRKYIDTDKLMSGVLGNLSPDVLESMELEGRIKGQKGWGDIRNLVSTYATDKEGNVVQLKTPDEIQAARKNEDLVVRTIFNPSNPYGNQFNNLINAFGMDNIEHDRKIIENGLGRMEDMEIKKQQMAQKAQQDAIDNQFKREANALKREENDLKRQENARLSIGTQGDAALSMKPWAEIGADGQPTVDNGTITRFKTNSKKRLDELNKELLQPNLAPEQKRKLMLEQKSLEENRRDLEHFEKMFKEHPEEFGYVPDKTVEQELNKAHYYDNIHVFIDGKMQEFKMKDLLNHDYLEIRGQSIYDTRTAKYNSKGDITTDAKKVGAFGDKQYNDVKMAQQADKNNKANIENRNNAMGKYLKTSIQGNAPLFYNPSENEKWDKAFDNTVDFAIADLPAKSVFTYNGKEYTQASLAAQKAKEAGHTDWRLVDVKGDKNSKAKVAYYKQNGQPVYGVQAAVTFVYETEDGKKKEIKDVVTVPSHTKENQPNFIIKELSSKLNSPAKKAEMRMRELLQTPGVGYETGKEKLYTLPNGKVILENKENKSKSELPVQDGLDYLEDYYSVDLDSQLNSK